MQRLKWLYTDHPVYFLTFCAQPRRSILANQQVHSSFRNFAQKALEHGIYVGRYMLMPDHVHLFAGFAPQSLSVSKWIKSLKNSISKALHDAGVPAPHWQKDFFDHVLRNQESLAEKWLYVRQNPVRAGLVSDPDDWPYQGEISHLDL